MCTAKVKFPNGEIKEVPAVAACAEFVELWGTDTIPVEIPGFSIQFFDDGAGWVARQDGPYTQAPQYD
jgi:hypothetical protein